MIIPMYNLTKLGGLFRDLFWGEGGKITPCLKLVRIMVET